jgi:osmotically-inducible protein OsmY
MTYPYCKFWWYPALFALGLLIVAAPALQPLNAAPTDDEVNMAVENYILFDSSVPSNYIDINTVNGIVTLGGTVPNILAKDRAAIIAESIKGVRAVVNNLMVKPVARSDEEIRRDLESAFRSDPVTDSKEVGVSLDNGIVTLTGTVDSWQEKQISEFVAKGVKGVTELKNEINISNKKDRADSEIAADIRAGLDRDVWVDSVLINAEVKDGSVTLDGTAGSAAEKHRALLHAWTAGVKSVDASGLKVEPWAKAESMKKIRKKSVQSDEEIREAVKDALIFDPRVVSFNLTIAVKNGIVTLSGVVDNLKAKNAAELDAKNTAGVWRVRNQLKVRGQQPVADETIDRNVKAALVRDPYVDRYDIGVSSEDGTVTLSGNVDSSYEKNHAGDLASGIKGVSSVNNSMTVGFPEFRHYSWPYSWYYNAPYYYNKQPAWLAQFHTDDAVVRSEIEERFYWNPFLNVDDIEVTVSDGVATLTGKVGSWSAFNDATENAYHGGAHSVTNKLEVE